MRAAPLFRGLSSGATGRGGRLSALPAERSRAAGEIRGEIFYMPISEPYSCYEVVIWKRATVAGVERYWCNSYQFTAPAGGVGEGTLWELCHNLVTAEHFIYTGDVFIFGVICWQWSSMDRFSDPDGVYIWPEFRYGVKVRDFAGTMLPWEYALLLHKETEEGRGGRVALRYCLINEETVPYGEDSRAIQNHEPWGTQPTALALWWFNNTPLQHCTFKRYNELTPPIGVNPVTRLTMGTLTKLQSVEDAQARKTPRALPYQKAWQESLVSTFAQYRECVRLATMHPDGLLKDDIEILALSASMLKGVFESILPYWTEGVKPVLMLNWRPTSGLDPLSINVQAVVGDAVGRIDELAPILEDLYSYPDDRVPYTFVRPFLVRYAYFILWLERCGAMRWTGTPIRGLPKVYD